MLTVLNNMDVTECLPIIILVCRLGIVERPFPLSKLFHCTKKLYQGYITISLCYVTVGSFHTFILHGSASLSAGCTCTRGIVVAGCKGRQEKCTTPKPGSSILIFIVVICGHHVLLNNIERLVREEAGGIKLFLLV